MQIAAEILRGIAERSLLGRGAATECAALQADLLIEAELRGLPSHGMQRLPRLLARIDAGLADPATSGRAEWTRSGILAVDGDRGLGPVVMMHALDRLTDALPAQGIALAAIRNANHIGMLAYYAEAAALRGHIAVVLTTSEALVHPFGGTDAMLGTNPVAVGVPAGPEPFVLDLATSTVSMGKIHHHALTGTPIPGDWAVDSAGNRTTDAEAAKTGAIAPFGGAKGYGLGLAIELLVAALAGSALAPEVRGTLDATDPANKGDILILIDPAAGSGRTSALAGYLGRLRASRPADPDHPVQVPGDGMRRRRAETMAKGIDLPDQLHDEILSLAEG